MWIIQKFHSFSIQFSYSFHIFLHAKKPSSLCPIFFFFSIFLPTQAYKGRALQLIKNLPVEFRCDKRSYSCQQDGEKAVPAAAIALLSVSKMKRLYFEARPLTKTPKHLTRCIAALPLLLFWHPLSSDALQWGSAAWTWVSVGLRSWPSVWRCCP